MAARFRAAFSDKLIIFYLAVISNKETFRKEVKPPLNDIVF